MDVSTIALTRMVAGHLVAGLMEFVRVPFADNGLTVILYNVSDEQALFVGDILATGCWAAKISENGEEDTVLIIGAGLTGLCIYSPDLRIKVIVAFGNFDVYCHLVRLIRLRIGFLSVKPRFRYRFFSPKGFPLKLASRYGVRRQLRPLWWTFTTDT